MTLGFWILPVLASIGCAARVWYILSKYPDNPTSDAGLALTGVVFALLSWVIYLSAIVAIFTP